MTNGKKVSIIYLYLKKGEEMENFIVNFFMVVFGIIISGGILVWVLNYITEELNNLVNMNFVEIVGSLTLLLVAALVALQL
ncbi:hypothetical protein OAA32_00545 [bacterium]|nr:hypothetical protein [bacterium]